MSASINELLTVYGAIGEQVLKDALDNVSATHKTVNSVRSQVTSTATKDTLQLLGREYINLLETGRKPTSKGPSQEMIDNLKDYARSLGFDDPDRAAWAIAKEINKKGDRTFRMGGRNVYSNELNKFVEELKVECKKTFVGSSLKFLKPSWQ